MEKNFFKFKEFSYNVRIKKKYLKHVDFINNFNKNLIKKITFLKRKFYISSFQTRNIPHYGHEIIIKSLMKKRGLVIINPLIGMKKKGDFKNEILSKIFENLLSHNEYKNKVFFNSQYIIGPRKHHINLREMLGFNRFTVGRDHAGAENNYKPLDAYNIVKKNLKKFKINVFLHKGSYYCKSNKKIILKSSHKDSNLTEISGSEFRENLLSKKYFKYARRSTQEYIYKLKNNLFYS